MEMKEFTYTIHDPLGIHARPAGMLVREARQFTSECTLSRGDTSIRATQLMKLMGLGVKQGDVLTVTASGEDEDAAIAALRSFFETNL